MNKQYFSSALQCSVQDNVITGYASVFHNPTDPGTSYDLGDHLERIAPTAFNKSLQSGKDIKALYNHDTGALLGSTLSGNLKLSLDSVGLRFTLQTDPTDPDHQRILPKLVRGDLRGCSFGCFPRAATWNRDGDRPVKTYTEMDLYEITLTAFPAFESTVAVLRSTEQEQQDKEELERFLREEEMKKRFAKFAAITL